MRINAETYGLEQQTTDCFRSVLKTDRSRNMRTLPCFLPTKSCMWYASTARSGYLQRETSISCFPQTSVYVNTTPMMGSRSICLQKELIPLTNNPTPYISGAIMASFNSGNLRLHQHTNPQYSSQTSKSTINLPYSTPYIRSLNFKENR